MTKRTARNLLPVDHSSLKFLDSILRTDLLAFIQKVFATVSPGQDFLCNWHLEALAFSLSEIGAGKTNRLIINIPPRHLKSICASVALPAYILGLDPTKRIICVSYSQDLAVKHANDCRSVMSSDWYHRVFPNTRIDDEKNTEAEFMTTQRGFRLATSVGGTLTGRGGNLIIIDDPIKPTDAMSQAARERVQDWSTTTLLSRLDDKRRDSIVLVMQRVHVDDLCGYFLAQGGWPLLRLEAIAETEQTIQIGPNRFKIRTVGELLHPEREPQNVLDQLKTAMGSVIFTAQYQQSPVPPGGHMIDWNWFRWRDPNSVLECDEIVISWDTALKSSELSDFSVGTVWGLKGDFYYLLDLIRVRLDYPALKRRIIEVYRNYFGSTILIEDMGSGTSLIQDLASENISVIPIQPEGDKVVRMSAQSAKVEAGRVYLETGAPWLDALKSEILAFPYGSHDDQVDSISQALGWMSRPRGRQFNFG